MRLNHNHLQFMQMQSTLKGTRSVCVSKCCCTFCKVQFEWLQSHFSLNLQTLQPDQEEQGLYLTKHGKISFVDLAGSEKVKELGSSSELLSETTNINKSLLTLGKFYSSSIKS